jgi:HSP20 family protein
MENVTNERKRYIRPVSNICEENGAVILRLEMPGVDKEHIEINIDGDTLTVHGKRAAEDGKKNYLLRERLTGDYHQTYTIDERVDREKVDAKMEKGVLMLTLHLKEEVKPRKIEVKAK